MHDDKPLEDIVLTQILRLNAVAYGLVAGIVAGFGLFLVTNWLVLKGGPIGPEGEPVVGPHLSLLSQFFPGYEVTFPGSFIGFAYAFVSGFLGAFVVAKLYNGILKLRASRSRRSG